jgi:hypothetical protein
VTDAPDDRSSEASDGRSTAELANPTRMLASEQQFGYLLAAALGGVTVASHVSAAVGGDGKAAALMALGLALAGVMAGAVRYGQRIITSFSAVIGGFAPLAKSYVGVSFLCLLYGAWLMWKASRAQQRARAAGLAPARRTRRRGTAGEGAGGGAAAGRGPGGRGPTANRRYTPPKKKTKSSRRA